MADTRADKPVVPRKRRPRTPAGIPFATVERLVARLHSIPDDQTTALKARLHNLRKLNFPDGVAAGSGRHFAYAAPDVIGIVVAFELMEAFVPPATAAAMVRSGWPEIARTAVEGARSASGAAITVHPRALTLMSPREGMPPPHHVEIAAVAGSRDPERTIDVDVGTVTNRALEGLQTIDPRSHALMLGGLRDIERLFGNGASTERPSGQADRLGKDGPFWQRASTLLAAAATGFREDDARVLTWFLDYAVRPAPVERWKTRVEVDPVVDDVGFGAALAWVCSTAHLQPSRTALPADELQRVGRRLLAALGSRHQVIERLQAIARKGSAS